MFLIKHKTPAHTAKFALYDFAETEPSRRAYLAFVSYGM